MLTSAGLQNATIYSAEIGERDNEWLGFVEFHVYPHLNSPYFPQTRRPFLEELARTVRGRIYAIDDTAVRVLDGWVEVVGEGEHLVLG